MKSLRRTDNLKVGDTALIIKRGDKYLSANRRLVDTNYSKRGWGNLSWNKNLAGATLFNPAMKPEMTLPKGSKFLEVEMVEYYDVGVEFTEAGEVY